MLILDEPNPVGGNEERLIAWSDGAGKKLRLHIALGSADEDSERGHLVADEGAAISLCREDALALAHMINMEFT